MEAAPSLARRLRPWLGPETAAATLLVGAATLEVAGRWRGVPWVQWSAWLWMAGGVSVLLASLGILVRALVRDARSLRLWGWPVLAFAAFATLRGADGVDTLSIDHEAAQQVSSGLALFASEEFGQRESAFLIYPARQYLLPALPSLVCGRSLLALRLGFGLPFLLGVGVFYAGLRAWLGSRRSAAAAAAVALPWCFSHWPGLSRFFEQSVLPPTLALFVGGWAMMLARRDVRPAAGVAVLAWLGGAAAMSYTPGLALACLVVAAAAAAAWRWRSVPVRLVLVLAMLAYIGLLIGLSLKLQEKTRFYPLGTELLLGRLTSAATAAALGQPFSLTVPLLLPAVLAALGAALAGWLGGTARLVALWALGSIAAAMLMHGYNFRPVGFDLQRAGVAIPALTWLLVEAARSVVAFARAHGWSHLLPPIPALVVLLVTLGGSLTILGIPPNSPRAGNQPKDYLLLDLVAALKERGLPNDLPFVLRAPVEIVDVYFGEQLGYFCPRARLEFAPWPADAPAPVGAVVFCYLEPNGACPPTGLAVSCVDDARGETVLVRAIVGPALQPEARSN